MSDELKLAFAHPEERASAMGETPVRDRISVRDLVVSADIGAFQPERDKGQRLRFNVVVEVLEPDAPLEDDVDRILSYDRITEAIHDELAAERLNLLESLAERIAGRILTAPQAYRVFLRIEKLDRVPGALGVEIMRDRLGGAETGVAPVPMPTQTPTILLTHEDQIASAPLRARLARALDTEAPMICVIAAAPSTSAPLGHETAQRRQNLLRMELAAWALAAEDTRLHVVGSRTELDWAMRHGKTVLWAPSKLVLDTPKGPADRTDDPAALAAWLAEILGGRLERL